MTATGSASGSGCLDKAESLLRAQYRHCYYYPIEVRDGGIHAFEATSERLRR
jgi:hypothetical protein